MPLNDITPVLTLVIGAAVTLMTAVFLPRKFQWTCALLSLAAVIISILLTVNLQLNSPAKLSFSGTWAVDDLTAWSSYAILGSTLLVILLSPAWFQKDTRHGEWCVILIFSALGAILMAGAADLMELMVAMLLSSVTGYILASYHRANSMCAEAGAKYYFIGALANPIMFFGILFMYALTADTSHLSLASALTGKSADPVIALTGLGMIFTEVAFKLGAVPGHPWVPDVAQGSPAPGGAFLTVIPKIGVLIALVRIVSFIPENLLHWRWVFAIIAALTMTLGNLAAQLFIEEGISMVTNSPIV